jgi:hypothetical protein
VRPAQSSTAQQLTKGCQPPLPECRQLRDATAAPARRTCGARASRTSQIPVPWVAASVSAPANAWRPKFKHVLSRAAHKAAAAQPQCPASRATNVAEHELQPLQLPEARSSTVYESLPSPHAAIGPWSQPMRRLRRTLKKMQTIAPLTAIEHDSQSAVDRLQYCAPQETQPARSRLATSVRTREPAQPSQPPGARLVPRSRPIGRLCGIADAAAAQRANQTRE